MNAVEIEEEVSNLSNKTFNEVEFPFQFLEAFGNKQTTIKKLKSGSANKSDIKGVLQRNNVHILVCDPGEVDIALQKLRNSKANIKFKVKFLISTDGNYFGAEDLNTGETVACEFKKISDYFGFFLPLAGISTVKVIRENAFDIKATGRLNKLYLELIRTNQDWTTTQEYKNHMNHFMARLIFCFFAEDTDIFGNNLSFTDTISQLSNSDSSNTHEIIHEIFRSMNTPYEKREDSELARWAKKFPYVNGELFNNAFDIPKFSRIARSYLINIGNLDWTKINPDIFGSMVQAVTEENDRGALGLHYTSIPNILKVLNPLFLDSIKLNINEAKDNTLKLKKIRKRLSNIKVFDPACGSGNFLVVAYKEMRLLENEINIKLREAGRKSEISLTNFRGIEIKSFGCDIARLALVIAEFQCNVLYLGQKEALTELLPLTSKNWITCSNALKCNWEEICFSDSNENKNLLSEIYICGNPPYLGSTWQSKEQKNDLEIAFKDISKLSKSLDYVTGWFIKAAKLVSKYSISSAFVSTNSICQGQSVPILWPLIFKYGCEINFAFESFKWANLAANNAGVSVIIVGITAKNLNRKFLYTVESNGKVTAKEVKNINAYLVPGKNIIIEKNFSNNNSLAPMLIGNKPSDGGNLLLTPEDLNDLKLNDSQKNKFIRRVYGSAEFIKAKTRYCLWIENENYSEANSIKPINERIEKVKEMRLSSKDKGANLMANRPHQMREMNIGKISTIIMPGTSSENRPFLPAGIIDNNSVVTNACFALFDAPIWNFSILVSRLHLIWIKTICGQLETRLRYSNTMGWNTFPVPTLTQKNKIDLTRSAEDILLSRETFFPKSLASLYESGKLPKDLEETHNKNDEIIERIYIGREFKNDSERLEKLFDMYSKKTKDKI